MKMRIVVVIGILFCSQIMFAQANLLVQSPDGKTVKLMWFLKSWNKEITGFDIKRKEGLQNWVKLNREPILPGMSPLKNLSVVETDLVAQSYIRAKVIKLLSSKQQRDMGDSLLLSRLNGDEQVIKELSEMMAYDFDIALMCGFAYNDHTVTHKSEYQYGIFISGTDKMLDSVFWSYGQVPDLNVVTDITSRSITSQAGIRVMWSADMHKAKISDVAVFNIYRDGILLARVPMTSPITNELAELSWYDETANSSVAAMYSISAESIFGIEGIIRSYTYNPEHHPAGYKKAEVSEIKSLGFYFKEGVSVNWNFPAGYERFIKGFYVEKDNMPGGYRQVSGLLDPTARMYIDRSPSPVSDYIRFRVTAVYIDRTVTTGIERLYSYFPISTPPQPQNLQLRGERGDRKYMVYLTWDPRMNGDSMTAAYRVYMMKPGSRHMELLSEQPVKTNNYTYTVRGGSAFGYSFCVGALGYNKGESLFSDTMSINVPSLDLPAPASSGVSSAGDKIVVKWQYPEIADLKGFRVFQNGVQVASENELGKDVREYATPVMSQGFSSEFALQAVSENGIVSEITTLGSISTVTEQHR